MSYIRFIAEEEGYLPCGIVTMSREMIEASRFNEYESQRIRHIFDLLNDKLPCPPFSEKIDDGEWTKNTISWFKPDAKLFISAMRELMELLKDIGVPVRSVTTERLIDVGEVVYEDEFQVVVEVKKYSWHRCA